MTNETVEDPEKITYDDIECMQCGAEFTPEKEQDIYCDECIYQKQKKKALDKLQEHSFKSLAVFIACQDLGIDPPKFPMTYTGFVLTNLSGRAEELAEACEKFHTEGRKILEAHENARS